MSFSNAKSYFYFYRKPTQSIEHLQQQSRTVHNSPGMVSTNQKIISRIRNRIYTAKDSYKYGKIDVRLLG